MINSPQLCLESERLAARLNGTYVGGGDVVPIDRSALDGRQVIVHPDDDTAPEPHQEAA